MGNENGKIDMRYTLFAGWKDELILLARVLLMALFVISGWSKLTGFSGTVAYMDTLGLPLPTLSAIIAIVIEFVFGIALALGVYARPLAILFALYALATAFIGHQYWRMTGAEHIANMNNFYKNVSIAGGFLLLSATGAGKYSIDRDRA